MATNLDNFFKQKVQEKKETPFDKPVGKKANSLTKDNAKPVKLRGDLHYTLKNYTAKNGGNIREIVDKAVSEYIEKNNIN
ncbi:hypothetical protein IGK74_002322 [Enterococcus sp. AZ150]|uniref:peptide-binding protein n=1 Tax=Enterococcus sp. AZ150 TaxID=2774866 RepID=UPI003F25E0DD